MDDKERLNLILPTEIKEYLKEAAWRNRKSVTQYLVMLIEADIGANPHIMASIKHKEG